MPDHSDSPRALIRYALVGLALTVVLTWTLYLVRGALLLIYMSVLVADRASRRSRARSSGRRFGGSRRLPRWAAILDHLSAASSACWSALALLVIPPLVEQARELWSALPDMLHAGSSG